MRIYCVVRAARPNAPYDTKRASRPSARAVRAGLRQRLGQMRRPESRKAGHGAVGIRDHLSRRYFFFILQAVVQRFRHKFHELARPA
jgi:hypothetical protein